MLWMRSTGLPAEPVLSVEFWDVRLSSPAALALLEQLRDVPVETILAPALAHWSGNPILRATLRSGAGSARETSALMMISVSTASAY